MILDEFVDLDEDRLKTLDVLIRQNERIAKSYNKSLRCSSKTFVVNDLVWKVIDLTYG